MLSLVTLPNLHHTVHHTIELGGIPSGADVLYGTAGGEDDTRCEVANRRHRSESSDQ